jgi:hypothetical protein
MHGNQRNLSPKKIALAAEQKTKKRGDKEVILIRILEGI